MVPIMEEEVMPIQLEEEGNRAEEISTRCQDVITIPHPPQIIMCNKIHCIPPLHMNINHQLHICHVNITQHPHHHTTGHHHPIPNPKNTSTAPPPTSPNQHPPNQSKFTPKHRPQQPLGIATLHHNTTPTQQPKHYPPLNKNYHYCNNKRQLSKNNSHCKRKCYRC